MADSPLHFHCPTQIDWGIDSRKWIFSRLKKLGKNPVLLTGKKVISTPLGESVYLEFIQHFGSDSVFFVPSLWDSDWYVNLERDFKMEKKNSLLVVGGGRVLDTGKFCSAWLKSKLPLEAVLPWKNPKIPNYQMGFPTLLVPTLSGSASEWNSTVVLTDGVGQRWGLHQGAFRATRALIDPQFLQGVPPSILACSLVDTFSHFAEIYCHDGSIHPFFDQTALDGMKKVLNLFENFPRGGVGWDETELGSFFLLGNLANGGFLLQRGGGFPLHVLEHYYGGRLGLSHGGGLALFLEPYLKWYTETSKSAKRGVLKAFISEWGGVLQEMVHLALREGKGKSAPMAIPSQVPLTPESLPPWDLLHHHPPLNSNSLKAIIRSGFKNYYFSQIMNNTKLKEI